MKNAATVGNAVDVVPSTAVDRAAQVTLTRTRLRAKDGHVPTTVAPMAEDAGEAEGYVVAIRGEGVDVSRCNRTTRWVDANEPSRAEDGHVPRRR